MTKARRIYITSQDLERINSILANAGKSDAKTAELLEMELDRAIVVPQSKIPPDVVTMNSTVVFEDLQNKKCRKAILVYPGQADTSQDKISILAPIGAALIGLSVGQSIDWPLPGNRIVKLQIISVEYQPEAAGDYHL